MTLTKPRMILFEGIASSGKTTLGLALVERLKQYGQVLLVPETTTLIPLIDNREVGRAQEFLDHVLDNLLQSDADFILVDRFHFTHAFRTSAGIENFLKIERRLHENFDTTILLLTISEEAIEDRIIHTTSIRGPEWSLGKQGDLPDRVLYYQEQQKRLLELADQSMISVIVLDTTSQDWNRFADQVVGKLL